MKVILVLSTLVLFFSFNSFSQTYMDGFCVQKVLDLETGKRIFKKQFKTKKLLNLYLKTIDKARAHYKEFANDPDFPILVYKAFAVEKYDEIIGFKIELWMDADEDVISYYFEADYELSYTTLMMFLWDNQSAEAHWFCES